MRWNLEPGGGITFKMDDVRTWSVREGKLGGNLLRCIYGLLV